MKMHSQGGAEIHGVVAVTRNIAPRRGARLRAIGGGCRKSHRVTLLLFCLFGISTGAQPVGTVSDTTIQGRQLAQKILDQVPPQNSTVTGILRIRSDEGTRSSIPVAFVIIAAGSDWESIYQATITNHSEILWIHHSASEANRYFWETNQPVESPDKLAAMEASLGELHPLSPAEIMTPFAGSDFCLADLGLEFFRWPEQQVLKQEIHRSRGCMVLESTNPHAVAGGYARVVSWIDTETLGIVEAYAFDVQGRKLKDFYPKDFKKVDGQWQVQTLVMENTQTGSRSRLEFELKK